MPLLQSLAQTLGLTPTELIGCVAALLFALFGFLAWLSNRKGDDEMAALLRQEMVAHTSLALDQAAESVGGYVEKLVDQAVTARLTSVNLPSAQWPRQPVEGRYIRKVATPQGDLWFVRFRPYNEARVVAFDVRRVLAIGPTSKHAKHELLLFEFVESFCSTADFHVQDDPQLLDELAPFLAALPDGPGGAWPVLYNFQAGFGLRVDFEHGRYGSDPIIYIRPPSCNLPQATRKQLFDSLFADVDSFFV